jgi:hypothetical protein
MKKLLLCLTLLASLPSFADDVQGLEMGCIARAYCEVGDYTKLDRVLVSQLYRV